MKSLRIRMLTIISSIVVIALVTLATLNFFQAKKIIQEDAQARLKKTAENQGENIKRWFDIYKAEINAFARSPIILEGSREEGLKYLASELKNNPLYQNIFLTDLDGESYGATGTISNVKDRNYFKEAIEGKTVVSDPVIAKTTGKLVVIIATPIVIDGKVSRVLTVSITVEDIVKQVLTVKIEQSGYAYVVDGDGTIIIHPDSEVANKKNILSSSDFPLEIRNFGEKVVKGETAFGSYTYDGEKKYVAYTQIPETDWAIVVNVSESEINSRLTELTITSIIIIFVVLSFIIFIIMLITDRIVTPIEELETAANRIASGDLSKTTVNINSKDEIGRLARAFEKMLENLYSSYEELEASNEEIVASEEELRQQNEKLQKSQEALQNSEERFRLAAQGSKDDIWDWDLSGGNKCTYYETRENNIINEVTYTLQAMKDKIHPDDIGYVDIMMLDHLQGRTPYFECEFREKTNEGKYRWILCRGQSIRDYNGKPTRMSGSNTDITERKIAEEKIRYMAHYDLLTDLPNRTLLNEKILAAFSRAKEDKNKVALLYLDLDDFKTVNDTLGHNYGDILLKEVSDKLKGCVGEEDTVSRLGGDEFAILLPNINKTDYVIEVTNKVMGLFKHPHILSGHEFFISVSIGITIYPEDGNNVEILMKNADTAMYSAKNSGKNGYQFFNQAMNYKVIERLEMENNLRHAIERNEFVVYYQPQVDLKSGKISGFEALIRWISPSKGMISPMDFIPLAEETGLIIPIGEWVLRTACEQIKLWQDKGHNPFNIAVNLSAKQFRQANLVENVNRVILETGIDPKLLELEITETTAMENIEATIMLLDKLKEKGIKISLDDFGTGYSSLNYLKKLPIDILKIDKDFIFDISKNKNQEEIAKTIISLAHNMKLEVVAEGVETVDKLNFLIEHNCDKVQGYLFSKPLNNEDIEVLLKSDKTFEIVDVYEKNQ